MHALSASRREKSSLPKHHRSVLAAVLRRCLLDGDYERAGRAWALMLRTPSNGKAANIRADGRWGMGAEILLRKGRSSSPSTATQASDSPLPSASASASAAASVRSASPDDEAGRYYEGVGGGGGGGGGAITRDGFRQARDYYERLILQYPYRRHAPAAVSALQFYPAMFALWIFMAQQDTRPWPGNASKEESSQHDDDDNDNSTSPDSLATFSHDVREEDYRREELLEADSIAARMDELMLSPPYSDCAELWHLRGMVALWIADLCSPVSIPTGEGEGTDEGDRAQDGEADWATAGDGGQGERTGRAHEEHMRAIAAFRRVRKSGGSVWEGVQYLIQSDDAEDGEPTH